jgi:hypothetical protein
LLKETKKEIGSAFYQNQKHSTGKKEEGKRPRLRIIESLFVVSRCIPDPNRSKIRIEPGQKEVFFPGI